MSFEDYIDGEDIEFVNELENPKKYHFEEHSDDTIHFYEDGEGIDYEEVVDLLNIQNEEIIELKTRNKRQYDLLKEITDLMMKGDWKGLEKIVEDWEESDRLLQAEWGNCGDVE